jgi:transmembrane sensor
LIKMPPVSEQISQILLKQLRHEELTAGESATLAEWMGRSPEHAAFIDMLMDEALLSDKIKGMLELDQQSAWQKIENALEAEWNERRPVARKTGLYKYAVVASIVVVLGVGGYFLVSNLAAGNRPGDIAPGQNRAVLTLSNGSEIDLGKVAAGVVAKDSGVSIVKKVEGKLSYEATAEIPQSTHLHNKLETARGGQYKVDLPDGTVAILNAASSIWYPTVFTGSVREVVVTGEVYFEVAKNAGKPFLVQVNSGKGEKRATVEVLGTHFNIKAYDDEPVIKTTLVEGKVKMSAVETNPEILLPGQQGQLSTNNKLSVSVVDVEKAVAWKNGSISFKDDDIPSIMRQIGRWYDVEIVFEGPVSNSTYSGDINRTENISRALEYLEYVCRLKFRIEKGKIIVSQ